MDTQTVLPIPRHNFQYFHNFANSPRLQDRSSSTNTHHYNRSPQHRGSMPQYMGSMSPDNTMHDPYIEQSFQKFYIDLHPQSSGKY